MNALTQLLAKSDETAETKKCYRCSEIKSVRDFNKFKNGFNSWCRECQRKNNNERMNSEIGMVRDTLNGIFGREAGTAKGYRYSKTMKASDITWNVVNLNLFLTKPRKFMKGTKMSFSGLKKEKDRTNIIAYILSLHEH